MSNQPYKIRSIGGGLVIALPQHIARAMELQAGDEVVIQAFDVGYKRGMITVKPLREAKKLKGKMR